MTFGSSLQGTLALKVDRAASGSNGTAANGAAASSTAANGSGNGSDANGTASNGAAVATAAAPAMAPALTFGSRSALKGDDHGGIAAGQLHHHGDGVLHAHDE